MAAANGDLPAIDPLVKAVLAILPGDIPPPSDGRRELRGRCACLDEDGNTAALIESKGSRVPSNGSTSTRWTTTAKLDFPPEMHGAPHYEHRHGGKILEEKEHAAQSVEMSEIWRVRHNVLLMRTLDLLRYADLVERRVPKWRISARRS
jgi:hypothetical protein